jgi:hypothetical protein
MLDALVRVHSKPLGGVALSAMWKFLLPNIAA